MNNGETIIIGLIGSALWLAGSWRSLRAHGHKSIPGIYQSARQGYKLFPATQWERALFLAGLSLLALAQLRSCSGV
jgi:hypothetical protein